jgi:phospholipase/carboxylesterase
LPCDRGRHSGARSRCQDYQIASVDQVPYRVRPARGKPQGALVLLHGRGTDENDLFPLIDMLDPEARLVGVTPRGPLSLPPGGAHWYIVREVGYPDTDTFHASFEALSGWLDALPEELGFPPERLVLGGFSQGCAMTYALGLGAGREEPELRSGDESKAIAAARPLALIALSGFVPRVDGFELDLEGHGMPVAIGHGSFDPIIPVQFGREARDLLEASGFEVTYRETPMGHSVDPGFVNELAGWLTQKFG